MTGESRVDEPRRRMREQTETAERGLPLEPGRDVVGQGDELMGRGEDELPGVEDEGLGRIDLDEAGELGLFERGIDDRVLVVVEEPEVAVEADVDARRLDEREVTGVQRDATGFEFGADVAVGKESHTPDGSRIGPRRAVTTGAARRGTTSARQESGATRRYFVTN